MKNTYIQSNKFKNKKFSKGEEVNNKDLEIVTSRTKTVYMQDKSYENYLSEEYSSVIFVADDLDFDSYEGVRNEN